MSGDTSLKPGRLVALRAWLRARPVQRAIYWAIASMAIVHLFSLLRGQPATTAPLLTEIVCWAIGAVFFYLTMRWWEARHDAR